MRGFVLAAALAALLPGSALAQYAAIAYSRGTDAFALSEPQASETAARDAARARCGREDCTVQTYRPGYCAALARAAQGIWGWAVRANDDASPAALEFCRRNGGAECRVVARHCLAAPDSYGAEAPPALENPQNVLVIVYTHGSNPGTQPDTCNMRQVNAPAGVPDVIHALHGTALAGRRVVVDGFCTPSTTARFSREAMLREPRVAQRARDLAERARAYAALGVPLRQVFLAGHDAGGWAALLALRENAALGGALAFAPAIAGETAGRPARIAEFRRQQIMLLQNARRLDALIFAFENDAFESAQALRFLGNVPGVRFEARRADAIDSQRCTLPAHLLVRDACFARTQEARIRQFLAARITPPPARPAPARPAARPAPARAQPRR